MWNRQVSAKKGNNMAKNKKHFYSEEEVKRRAKKYDCDGMCYVSIPEQKYVQRLVSGNFGLPYLLL